MHRAAATLRHAVRDALHRAFHRALHRALGHDHPSQAAGRTPGDAAGRSLRRTLGRAAGRSPGDRLGLAFHRSLRHALCVALGLALATPPAAADDTRGLAFDIRLGGVRVATVALAGSEAGSAAGGSYRATARIETTGAARLVTRFAYRGEVEGRRTGSGTGSGFAPRRYAEQADTGRRQSQAEVVWRDGLPQVTADTRSRLGSAEPVPPEDTRGTLDPLTGLWAALRDRPAAAACGTVLRLFDGARLSRLTLGPPEPPDPPRPAARSDTPRSVTTGPGSGPGGGSGAAAGRFACRGEYRRLAGFPEEEMRRRTRFALRLEFEPLPGSDLVRVSRVTLDTLQGPAELVRR